MHKAMAIRALAAWAWTGTATALLAPSPLCDVLAGCLADTAGAGLGLLQTQAGRSHLPARLVVMLGAPAVSNRSKSELVLAHIPYNFGHTIEKVAAFGSGKTSFSVYGPVAARINGDISTAARWKLVNETKRADAKIWGHMNPDLFGISEVTGCPLYYTPGKYWPKEIAEAYFGDKTIFGMLRDPYERLVAMFRGNFGAYGGSYPQFFAQCDVNGAVRKMMTDYLAGDIYGGQCTFVPQAEYFDPPFGIELAVDNRLFPGSANEVFDQYGYDDLHIASEDVLHVTGCPEVWAGDLDCETKALVKKVYARDFELLCSKFGYCDQGENTCIKGVPMMCPSDLSAKEQTATHCE